MKLEISGDCHIGSMAEWSKALVLGTSPKGRGFESHHCQKFFGVKKRLETPGIEPGTSHMRSERSTTELHPHGIGVVQVDLERRPGALSVQVTRARVAGLG